MSRAMVALVAVCVWLQASTNVSAQATNGKLLDWMRLYYDATGASDDTEVIGYISDVDARRLTELEDNSSTNGTTNVTKPTSTVAPTPAPTAVKVTTTTGLTTTTMDVKAEEITGTLAVDVADVDAFCNSSAALRATADGIATTLGINNDMVTAMCTVGGSRRLGEHYFRRLAAANVEYTILIKNRATTDDIVTAIQNAKAETFTANIATKINEAVDNNLIDANVKESLTPTVQTLTAPQVTEVTFTVTSTTETTTTITTVDSNATDSTTQLVSGVDSFARRQMTTAFAHLLALIGACMIFR